MQTRVVQKRCRCGPARRAPVLVALLILAGCGGSSQPKAKPQVVAGPGYRFDAPTGWTVERARLSVTAMDGPDFVQVFSAPLVKTYRPALFAKVDRELKAQMDKLAGAAGKAEPAGSVTVAGIRSHVYRLSLGGHVDEYTFVLVGRREYQLLCRAAAAGGDVCRQLQSSFRLS